MPLFRIGAQGGVALVPHENFATEKTLQTLVERNLGTIFNCRFVASEHPTGAQHAGRIDTLALSEDGNPVIIEYKKVESSELVNQSLYYLAWLDDHRGDFSLAAQKALGNSIAIDWDEIRVICLAPNYRKYDVHAVQMMSTTIELWTYRRFQDQHFYLEQVYPSGAAADVASGKNPIMIAAGKKAALTRANATWTFDQRLENKPGIIRDLALKVHEFMLGLSSSIEESPKKLYVAYRTAQNIVCMEVQQQKIYLYVKLDPSVNEGPQGISRDVSHIGHFGTGDLEITVRTSDDLEAAKPWLTKAFESFGG